MIDIGDKWLWIVAITSQLIQWAKLTKLWNKITGYLVDSTVNSAKCPRCNVLLL